MFFFGTQNTTSLKQRFFLEDDLCHAQLPRPRGDAATARAHFCAACNPEVLGLGVAPNHAALQSRHGGKADPFRSSVSATARTCARRWPRWYRCLQLASACHAFPHGAMCTRAGLGGPRAAGITFAGAFGSTSSVELRGGPIVASSVGSRHGRSVSTAWANLLLCSSPTVRARVSSSLSVRLVIRGRSTGMSTRGGWSSSPAAGGVASSNSSAPSSVHTAPQRHSQGDGVLGQFKETVAPRQRHVSSRRPRAGAEVPPLAISHGAARGAMPSSRREPEAPPGFVIPASNPNNSKVRS